MTTEKMSVHEALSELKTLGQRIDKLIRTTTFVQTNKHANTKINGKSIDIVKKEMKANYQKISDLIARRDAIKRAVTLSNAITKVTLTQPNGQVINMTVAELIEYKTIGIQYIESLRDAISRQYDSTKCVLDTNNGEYLEEKADQHITAIYGNKDNIDKDTISTTRASFIEANTLDLIDPNNVTKILEDLDNKLTFYQTKVDSALSTSNAITQIEINI